MHLITMLHGDQATRASLLLQLRDAGSNTAWDQFVAIYAPLIYSFCRKHNLQHADAADVTQEVMRSVAHSIQRFDYQPQRGKFRSWLLTITRNKVNTFKTAAGRRHEPRGRTSIQNLLDAVPSAAEQSSWDAEYHGRLLQWAAEQVRPTIQEKTWQAFWRTTMEEEEPAQVAADLELTVGAVYVAKSRVLARLKDTIQSIDADAESDFPPR